MSRAFQLETNPGNARPLAQRHGQRGVYYNPPAFPLEDGAGSGGGAVSMDELYDLPFTRVPHPMYTERIPGYETVKHSLVLMRGCFGGCTFCSITEHEGRVIQNRSAESVLREIRALRRQGDFRGTITDLGGPTANMYKLACKSPEIESKCRRLSCVHPGVCENLKTDHGPLIQLMQRVRKEDGVKHVFIASGVRYDLAERSPEYVEELARHHVGGQLSVAPEHVSPRVLEKMKKPGIESYERFQQMFACASKDAGKEQYDIPYFISGHPGSTLEDMVELALWLKKNGRRPRQVQDFIPTPMAMATCMYHTGIDPLTMQPVYTATGPAGQEAAEGAAALLEPRAVAARPRGAPRGRPRRPHRRPRRAGACLTGHADSRLRRACRASSQRHLHLGRHVGALLVRRAGEFPLPQVGDCVTADGQRAGPRPLLRRALSGPGVMSRQRAAPR